MKQFLCLILSAVLLTGLLAGCGKKKNDTESDPAAGAAGTLTIQEDDTMNLSMLFSLMSTPDHGVTELLGEGNDQKYNGDGILTQREYDGIAYGQHIIFTVSYNDYGDVSSIDVDFKDDVTRQQLTDMVTELLNRQPKEDGKWHSDTATVSIVEHDGHLGILLEQFEVESAEDPNQY